MTKVFTHRTFNTFGWLVNSTLTNITNHSGNMNKEKNPSELHKQGMKNNWKIKALLSCNGLEIHNISLQFGVFDNIWVTPYWRSAWWTAGCGRFRPGFTITTIVTYTVKITLKSWKICQSNGKTIQSKLGSALNRIFHAYMCAHMVMCMPQMQVYAHIYEPFISCLSIIYQVIQRVDRDNLISIVSDDDLSVCCPAVLTEFRLERFFEF